MNLNKFDFKLLSLSINSLLLAYIAIEADILNNLIIFNIKMNYIIFMLEPWIECQLNLDNSIRFLDFNKILELGLDKSIHLQPSLITLLSSLIVIKANTLDNIVIIELNKWNNCLF